MTIHGFIWDEQNIQHIAKHSIAPSEVDEMLSHPWVGTKERFGRFGLFGVSRTSRYLVAIIEQRNNDMFYVITAFEMDKEYKEFYLKEVVNE